MENKEIPHPDWNQTTKSEGFVFGGISRYASSRFIDGDSGAGQVGPTAQGGWKRIIHQVNSLPFRCRQKVSNSSLSIPRKFDTPVHHVNKTNTDQMLSLTKYGT